MHPTSAFAVLIFGVFLVGFTLRVAATDYMVSAVIQAPLLQTGAIITNPGPNAVFTTRPVIVTGECPDDSYVRLLRNSTFSGTAICINNKFEIETDLFVGINDLQAQAYNITDQPGPQTPIIRVVYEPLASPSPDTAAPFLITSDYYYSVITTSDVFNWNLQLRNGNGPYQVSINWGDGSESTMSVTDSDEFGISHKYEESGYYTIIVSATDASNRNASLQLLALIKKPGQPLMGGSLLPPPNGGSNDSQWLMYVWPTYAVVVAMLVSFWLGERREYLELTKKPRTKGQRLSHR